MHGISSEWICGQYWGETKLKTTSHGFTRALIALGANTAGLPCRAGEVAG